MIYIYMLQKHFCYIHIIIQVKSEKFVNLKNNA